MSQRQSKDKPQSVYGCDWAMREESSGCIFEFVHNTPFETFWRTIGAVEGVSMVVVSRTSDKVRRGTIGKGKLSEDVRYGNDKLDTMQ